MLRASAALAALALLGGCATSGPHLSPAVGPEPAPPLPEGQIAYEVFLLGNTADGDTDVVLQAVREAATSAGERSAVVLLGDQTSDGLPDSSSANYRRDAAPLDRLTRTLGRLPGRVFAVPGDRDWGEGRRGLRRQAAALAAAFGDSTLVPFDQSGGPVSVELADGLRLVLIDTGWWLRDADDRPAGEALGENVRSPADVALLLDRALTENADDRQIVVGHHPLRSAGFYAGQWGLAPGLATLGIGPLWDQTVGRSAQSLAAPGYRRLRDALDGILGRHDGVLYASAHEQSLQVFDVRRSEILGQTYLISGTGGGGTRAVVGGHGARLAAAVPGYQRLVYYADGRLVAETVGVDPASGFRHVLLRDVLAEAESERLDPQVPARVDPASLPPEIGGTVTQTADADFVSPRMKDGTLHRFLWGRGYRDVWRTPVTFPVLDMGAVGGGLTPLQTGGGLQTTGLRLQGADGYVYELRLIEKSGLAQVPEPLRDGAVGDIVLDLRSATNPYGPATTGPMAEAAGVLQTRFRLVYVPDDPRLGRYRSLFARRIAQLSIRPDDDVSAVPGLIGAADVVSEGTLYEKLAADQDHRVDARAHLRARLLDNVIADWDRHAGQWRWAAYEPGELDPSLTGDAATRGKVYRPIARDRDFAFHDIGGLLPWLIGYAADGRLQAFEETIDGVRYLNQNGFPQDRRLLSPLTRDDWRAVAAELQAQLTDAVIDRAVAGLPPEISPILAERYRRTLRGRRDDLPRAAERLYRLHAGTVDVVGSDEREHFTADRGADGRLTVTVTSGKDGAQDRVLYRRTFVPGETREVRLYGFGGRDRFEVTGRNSRRITVRLVGGAGRDTLTATGPVLAYDTPDGLRIDPASRGVDERLADDGRVNLYDPNEAVLGRRMWLPVVGYRPTDGVVLGVAHSWVVPGFRFAPWAATHSVRATVSTATGGLEAAYTGRMREAVGRLDLDVDALASTPRYVRNFYGLGNNSFAGLAPDSVRLDLARAQFQAGLGGRLAQGIRFVVGPTVRWADPQSTSLFEPIVDYGRVNTSGEPQVHAGAFGRLSVATADPETNPAQGVRLSLGGAYQAGVGGEADPYGQVGAEAAVYIPLSLAPQATLAVRSGVDHRLGTYPFFDAAVLGGEASFGASAAGAGGMLRGYRRERFAGRTAASASAELRAKLFDLAAYIAPFEVGGLVFVDAGRVWTDAGEVCGVAGCVAQDFDLGGGTQVGTGAGLWLEILNRAVLNATVGRSDESTIFTFGLGFAY